MPFKLLLHCIHLLPANDAASSWWLDPTPKSAKWRHHNRRETSETTPHSSHFNLSLISLTFSSRWSLPRPVKRHPPSDQVPPSRPPHGPPPLTFPPLHPSLSCLSPTSRRSVSPALREPPSPFLPSTYPGGDWASLRPRKKTLAQSVAIGFTPVGSLSYSWCAINGATVATLWFIPQQTTGGWPRGAAPHVPQQSHLQHPPGSLSPPTWSAHVRPSRHGDSLSHRSLSIIPSSPPAQTSTAVPRNALERGRLLQFNCNGIVNCHAVLQDFLHRHQVLVACIQETKFGVNSSLKEFTDYATVRRDHPTGGGGWGLVTLVHHSLSKRVPDRGILPDDGSPGSRDWPRGNHIDLRQCLHPPASSCPLN